MEEKEEEEERGSRSRRIDARGSRKRRYEQEDAVRESRVGDHGKAD